MRVCLLVAFDFCQITSWVEETQKEHDFDADADGSSPRSYVSCVSEVTGTGIIFLSFYLNIRGTYIKQVVVDFT